MNREREAATVDLHDYLRLLPKAELHCHFVSTLSVDRLFELARRHSVALRTDDHAEILRYRDLADFLDVFNAAHDVLTTGDEIAQLALDAVADGVRDGNLRYREYFINPDNFAPRIDYPSLIDAMVDGLEEGKRRYGVGYRIIVAINRARGAAAAEGLVETVAAHPRDAVVGIGMDDLAPGGHEAPLTFIDAYAAARRHGLRLTAHVGETLLQPPQNVIDACTELKVERIDHGYRTVDDPDVLSRMLECGLAYTCTPHSTLALSGWEFTPDHRIAQLIRAGIPLSFATDDAVFFRTDIGREYTAALPAMGFGAEAAKRIARTGFEMAWCDDAEKKRMLAEVDAQILALDAALVH